MISSMAQYSHGCHTWVSYMGAIHGCHTWVSYMGVIHGCYTWVSYMGVIHGCHTWVTYMGVTHGCHTWVSYMATESLHFIIFIIHIFYHVSCSMKHAANVKHYRSYICLYVHSTPPSLFEYLICSNLL